MSSEPVRPRPQPTVITHTRVIDGSGAPAYLGDVVLEHGKITAILPPGGYPDATGTTRVIDGAGLITSPGFIDMHGHSELQILLHPEHPAKLTQGVTTEVFGQDGLSYAPVDDATLGAMRQKLAGWNGNPSDLEYSWRTVGEYLDRLDAGIGVNAAYLLPQGTIRALAMGLGPGDPTPEQLSAQVKLVADGMEQGAVGLSSGLTYTPGMYAGEAELARLCATVAAYGGYYAPHHRSYGAGALDAYAQMIALAAETGVALHLTHATMDFAPNEGKAPELLAMLDAALEAGVDITCDTYPYLSGATSLASLLPGWAAAGDAEAVIARLEDDPTAAKIRHDMEANGSDGGHGMPVDWDSVEIASVGTPQLNVLAGQTIAEIARIQRVEPFTVFCNVLAADRLATGVLLHVGNEENVQAITKHRTHTGGSAGMLVGTKPHPRGWGTFPRFISHYARDLGLMDLPEMVHHLTGRPAARLKLAERGLLRAGYAADLVVFDPDALLDMATYTEPRQPAAGINYVFVNGVCAIDDHRPTGALAGRALRRTPEGNTQAS
ncbi:N-acyl-D-amino-acid deacylase family protein [Paeniglutamicibacter kerguelensis]|uniref:N-acyl-D-amino-acid deacylase n=1 Tax=Paeniglutamicibacter kerguelensis TaxID=254788 RepID=A0ABS4XGW0_9MICC|nr:D-aminoacylase [Paeniglutamicibacter kerguelensis]MBP2387633.1 N-acyl-D-amino-acid deacylase [Paeniglutamicibacter kerguelensis]